MQVSFTIPWLTRKRLLALMPLAVIPVVIFTSASACNGGGAAATANTTNGNILGHYDNVQPPLEPTGHSVYRDTLTYAEATAHARPEHVHLLHA